MFETSVPTKYLSSKRSPGEGLSSHFSPCAAPFFPYQIDGGRESGMQSQLWESDGSTHVHGADKTPYESLYSD